MYAPKFEIAIIFHKFEYTCHLILVTPSYALELSNWKLKIYTQ